MSRRARLFAVVTTLMVIAPPLAGAEKTTSPGGPPPWLYPDRSEPAGTHYRTFQSQLAGGEVSYLIYLPPDYQSNSARRYPVVYWLHGYGGSQRGGAVFVTPLDAAIRAGKAPPMIVVLVNGLPASFYCDSQNGKLPVDSVITKELIPHIDQTYRTLARRDARAVEGFSMGGYGAAHLGFKHPDLFGLVSVRSGALTDSVEWGPLKPPQGGRRKIMLAAEKSYFEANDLATVIRHNADAIRGKTKVRIAVGSEDSLLPNNQALHEFLTQLKIEHDYQVVPGAKHDPAVVYRTLGDREFDWYRTAWAEVAPSSPALSQHAAQSAHAPAAQTFTYKVAEGCQIKADVYGAAPGAKKPGLMSIHGGALMGGSRKPLGSPVANKLLKLGYVIVSIDYRLAPQTKIPQIIEDLQDAWRWMRKESPRLGIDPERIAVSGGSAGGYLTLMSGCCLDPRPRVLVSYFGYGDIDGPWLAQPYELYRRQPLVDKETAYQLAGGPAHSEPPAKSGFYLYCRQNGIWPEEVSGHDPHAEPHWFDRYCPIRNVTAKYPPTMLVHGTDDTDVPYAESQAMAAKLAEAGVEHQFITIPGAGHGLKGGKPEDVAQAADRAVEFIEAHTKSIAR